MRKEIDNDKGYYVENCRWSIKSVQNANKRLLGSKYLKGAKPNGSGTDFQARIKIFDKEIYIGNFKTEIEAHEAFVSVHREWYGF